MGKTTVPPSFLRVKNLSLQVHLGCTAEERASTQEIRVDVAFRFNEPPPGEKTDRLEDTLCYAEVCAALKNHLAGREFNLVEKIGCDFHRILKARFPNVQSQVKVHKVRPPVDDLLGGVEYLCGDTWS